MEDVKAITAKKIEFDTDYTISIRSGKKIEGYLLKDGKVVDEFIIDDPYSKE